MNMNALFWGMTAWGLAFALHLLIWKIRLPKHQSRTLIIIFFSFLAILGLTVGLWTPITLAQFCSAALLHLSLTFAYLITYSAMEADSPTLVIIMAVHRAGPEGIAPEKLSHLLSDDLLIHPRLRDLINGQLACQEGGKYLLTRQGRKFVRLFILFRKLLGAGKGG